MQNLVIPTLEKILNAYLRLDPETITRLAKHANKVVAIELTDWHSQFFLILLNDGIRLQVEYTGEIHSTIKGKAFDLLKVGVSLHKQSTPSYQNIEIIGDVELGRTISQILQDIDIDWEEQMSKLIGDVLAHQVGNVTRNLLDWSKQTVDSLQRDIGEYIQQEIKLLPPREELEDFFADIHHVHNAVERIAARINLLNNKAVKKDSV